jgi:RNA polymerase sigma-70 factor (ECF subfamily)
LSSLPFPAPLTWLPDVPRSREESRSPPREESRSALDAARDPERERANAAMERYARGEDDAFSDLYDALAPRLRGYLLRASRDPGCADDLLQQTMLQIHRARGRFIAGAEVLPWADELVDSDRLARALERELERLPEPHRAAFELVKNQGLSIREAAAVLGATPTAVKLRAHRAYAALRSALGDFVDRS